MRPTSLAPALAAVLIAAALGGCSSSADQPREPVDMAAAQEEIATIAAIKEEVVLSTQRATARLGRENGYFNDNAVRVPLPDDAQYVAGLLRDADLGYLIDDLELAMNRAAEKAAAEADAILVPAAESMLVVNASKLVAGKDTAITQYFRQRTANEVASAYAPVIRRHLENEPGYQQWTREIPEKRREYAYLNTTPIDLVPHVTDAALDGLFTAIGHEEVAIRTRPEKRATEGLQDVFGRP